MSSSVDQRIVEMAFKGESFLQGINNAVNAISKLTHSLSSLKGGEGEINSLDEAGKRFSLRGMSDSLDNISSKFGYMHIAAVTAFTNIVNRAVNVGINITKALTIDPIKAGLDVYETKINAIQTILANTASEGTNLQQVTAALNNLNQYANLTVYNFGEMAKNIGTFTAAGVGLQTSVESIKGIANLAALSGSSAEQASTAMYQLSQAIAAGRVKLQDWNSVVNAGLGGKVFQHALEDMARASGVNIDAIEKKFGGFRNSLQQGWLTSDILTKTLTTFTGDLSLAQIKALGFTDKEAQAIQKQAQVAVNSATQIRTTTQLFQALKEEVATAWASVFEAIIGNIGDATSTLSRIHNVLETLFTAPIYDLAKFLEELDKLGVRDDLITAFSEAFHILATIIHTVAEAWRAVFPPASVQAVSDLGVGFKKLVENMQPSAKTLGEIKTIFIAVFSVVKLGITVIGDLFKAFTKAGSGAGTAGGGLLALVAAVARWVTLAANAIGSSKLLADIFSVLAFAIKLPFEALGLLVKLIESFGSLASNAGGSAHSLFDALRSSSELSGIFKILAAAILLPIVAVKKLADSLHGFGGEASKAQEAGKSFVSEIGQEFSKLADAIVNGIKAGDLNKVGTLINQVLLAGVLVSIRKFFKSFTSIGSSEGGGFFSTIKESFESLTSTLKQMQATLKATTLLEIAAAVAILAASLVALSLANPAHLATAIAAITALFVELSTAMLVMTKVAGSGGIVKMTSITLALNGLATSVGILAVALALLAHFTWDQLENGLKAISRLLLELVIAALAMSQTSKGMVASAIAMNFMATAINILAIAVATIGKLPVDTIVHGVAAIAIILGALVLATNAMAGKATTLIATAVSITIIAVAMNLLAIAVKTLGSLPYDTLTHGLGAVLIILGSLALAMNAMSELGPRLIATAVAMVIIGAALDLMATAIHKLGSMNTDTLTHGLGAMALTLGILSLAMNAMEGSIPGAAALVVVAAALLILADVLNKLGSQSSGSIEKALLELAGALVLIAAAMLVMVEALPGAAALIIVAAALAIITPVLIALGSMSWDAIAKGLIALAGAFLVIGAAGLILGPLVPVLIALGVAIGLLGLGFLAVGGGIALFALGITALGVAVAASGVAILSFVGSILSLIPLTLQKIGEGIVAFATAIGNGASALVSAFVKIVIAIANGIAKALPETTKAITAIITAFLTVAVNNTPKILAAFTKILLDILTTFAKNAGKFAEAGGNVIVQFLNGVAKDVPRVAAAATGIIVAWIDAIGKSTVTVVNAGIVMVIKMINGIADAIRSHNGELRSAMANLGSAMIQGLIGAILGGLSGVVSAIGSVLSSALSAAKHLLGISSPSKVYAELGDETMQGWELGHRRSAHLVVDSIKDAGDKGLEALRNSLTGINDLIGETIDLSPKITPVVDLTQARKGFGLLSEDAKSTLLAAVASANSAAFIASVSPHTGTPETAASAQGSTVSFTQNNYSPASLSAIDIYRQTRNQLSIAKGVLTGANAG